MFSQVVQGRTNDPVVARRAMARWASSAGTAMITAGVTADGTLIAVTTVDSEESARAINGDWHGVLDG